MKENELRIGNLVTWVDEDDPNHSILTVTGVYLNDSVWVEWEWTDGTNDGTDCDFDTIKPIPLTEEWLVKFGYQYDDTANIWFINDGIQIDILKTRDNNFVFDFAYAPEIQFVHSFQNLYFCLTNKELIYEKV